MTIKVSIIGVAKSGTSALYSSVKAALPVPRRLLFEPTNAAELAYVTASDTENGLTKLMFGAAKRQDYDPAQFTHNIAIVRDPRDTVVSSTLFRFNRLKLLNNAELFDTLVAMFERKEADPKSVSMLEILEAAGAGEAEKLKDGFADLLGTYSDYLDEGHHHVLTFDQMIEGDFDKLNAYLGLTLVPPPPLGGWVSKISRKGESGDWKNWFTEEDVAYFRDAMDPFIQKYGFDVEWSLNDMPTIEPAHCSEYIRRLSEARKVDPNLKSDVGSDMESLLSAAEDGKVNALMKLVDIHDGDGPDADPSKLLGLTRQLADMGYPKYLVKTARLLIQNDQEDLAITYLDDGIKRGVPGAFLVRANRYLHHKNDADIPIAVDLLERGAELGNKTCIKRLKTLKERNVI